MSITNEELKSMKSEISSLNKALRAEQKKVQALSRQKEKNDNAALRVFSVVLNRHQDIEDVICKYEGSASVKPDSTIKKIRALNAKIGGVVGKALPK